MHLDYDQATATLTCRRPQAEAAEDAPDVFYEQLPFCDIADVLRFVNWECRFLAALTPLQPRYAKQVADEDGLLALISAQAINHGNWCMARTSDIPSHVLETAYQQYLGLATLQAANDPIRRDQFDGLGMMLWLQRCDSPGEISRDHWFVAPGFVLDFRMVALVLARGYQLLEASNIGRELYDFGPIEVGSIGTVIQLA
jgi:hypothetical protein